jgi:hypothetical protein
LGEVKQGGPVEAPHKTAATFSALLHRGRRGVIALSSVQITTLQGGMPTKKLFKLYLSLLTALLLMTVLAVPAYAVEDMWTVANRIIVDVYTHIAGISTVLAGLMSAVAVIGAKLSNNQHKVDQAWDWLKRIWIAWAVINGIGAFIAYVAPLFSGLATISP